MGLFVVYALGSYHNFTMGIIEPSNWHFFWQIAPGMVQLDMGHYGTCTINCP
jgi:hypothetical protein